MVRNKKKRGNVWFHPDPSCRYGDKDKLAQLGITEILRINRTDVVGSSNTRICLDASRPPTTKSAVNRKGFLDLPGEIRNTIYHLISNQLTLGELYMMKTTGPTHNMIHNISKDDNEDLRPLAIVGVNRQVREEFLSLLVFGDASTAQITAEDLARYGSRHLDNPHYVQSLWVSCDMEAKAMYCPVETDSTELVTSGKKNKCELCVSMGNIPLEFSAYFEVGLHRITALFRFGLDDQYVFTQKSRSLIEAICAQFFKTNDDVNVANVVLAAERMMLLHLDAVRVKTFWRRASDREVRFEVRQTVDDARPELWATPYRDLLDDRKPITECVESSGGE